jgi:hypothetical protein
MKKYNIKLNQLEFDSIKTFMERTSLSGNEIQVFMSVVSAINEADNLANKVKIKNNNTNSKPKISMV